MNTQRSILRLAKKSMEEKEAAIIYTVLLGSIGVFGILSLLWSLFKKPILLALNSILLICAIWMFIVKKKSGGGGRRHRGRRGR